MGTNKSVDETSLHALRVEKHGRRIATEGKKSVQEIIVRQSELKRWLRCRRAAYWQYTEGWIKPTKDKDVRGVGTHFHGLMAEYYGHEKSVELDNNFNPDDVATSQVMYDTYVSEMEESGMDIGQTTVAVEKRMHTLAIPVSDDVRYKVSCQVDHVYKDEALYGSPLIGQDHKTSSAFFNTSTNDFQLMTYAVVLHDNDFPVEYMEHNIVKRNKRTVRAKPPYVQRNRIRVTEEALAMWWNYLRTICTEHFNAHESSVDISSAYLYPNPDNTCTWGCDFVDVCSMVEEGEDYTDVLQTEYQLKEEEPHGN